MTPTMQTIKGKIIALAYLTELNYSKGKISYDEKIQIIDICNKTLELIDKEQQ